MAIPYLFYHHAGPQIRVRNWKLFVSFLNQNICCGYSEEPSHREHPKHMFELVDKKIIAILRKLCFLNLPYNHAWENPPERKGVTQALFSLFSEPNKNFKLYAANTQPVDKSNLITYFTLPLSTTTIACAGSCLRESQCKAFVWTSSGCGLYNTTLINDLEIINGSQIWNIAD